MARPSREFQLAVEPPGRLDVVGARLVDDFPANQRPTNLGQSARDVFVERTGAAAAAEDEKLPGGPFCQRALRDFRVHGPSVLNRLKLLTRLGTKAARIGSPVTNTAERGWRNSPSPPTPRRRTWPTWRANA